MRIKSRIFLLTVGLGLTLAASLSAQEPVDAGRVLPSAREGAVPKVCVLEMQPTKKVVYSVATKEYCVKHTFRLCSGGCSLFGDKCSLFGEKCSLFGVKCPLFGDKCPFFGNAGACDGQCAGGCETHTKQVLIKKICQGKIVEKCVLKDAPACGAVEMIGAPKK